MWVLPPTTGWPWQVPGPRFLSLHNKRVDPADLPTPPSFNPLRLPGLAEYLSWAGWNEKGKKDDPMVEAWSPGTYHRSVGMGDPKNGQSSRVRLYRITLMSWFRGDSIRGGTSAIPRELSLGGESSSSSLWTSLISLLLLLTAAFSAPVYLPPSTSLL